MEHFLELFVNVVLKVGLPLIECSIKGIECRLKIIETKKKLDNKKQEFFA